MMLWIISLFVAGLYHGVNTQCAARGRFPNDITEDCRGYTTCIATTSSSFYQYDLACPPKFIYNHLDSQCTNATGYRCLTNYNCATLGNFPNENSTDCTSYVACIQGLTSLSARLIDCPPNTVYNRNDAFCVEDSVYTCPQLTTTVQPAVAETEPSSTGSDHHITTPKPNSACFTGAPSINYMILFVVYFIRFQFST